MRCGLVMLALAAAVVVFIGCGGSGGSESSGGGSSGTPEISVSTTLLDFGAIVIDNFSDRSITAINTGTATLAIGQIGQLSAPFAIVEDKCSGSGLPVSSTCSIKVRFSPTSQTEFTGTFNITSNDNDENPLIISLRGSGTAYDVSINRVDKNACPDKLSLLISVVDNTGAPVTTLIKENFRLFENSSEIDPTNFTWSQVPVNAPLSASLVLDYSSSTIPITSQIEAAAKSFVAELKAGVDEVEVIKFDKDVFTIQGFTTDRAALVSAIDNPFPDADRFGTSLYDAILRSIEDTSTRANTKLSVIAVTDGEDTFSTATIDEVIDFAIQKGIPVFTISVGTEGAEQLQRLAEQTGGQYFLANTASDLEVVYLKISQVLSNQYLIEYPTTSSGGNTVLIDVEVDNNGLRGNDSRNTIGC
jgi:VWFA-related protein